MLSQVTLRLKPVYYSGKAYNSCASLPLYNFIKIVCGGSLDNLLIRGKVKDLEGIWEKIHEEYTTLTKDTSVAAAFRLIREIYYTNNKIVLLDKVVDYLRMRYVSELCQQLREMGFRHDYTPKTIENDLKLVVTQRKSWILKLKQAADAHESLKQTDKSEEADFYDTLAILEKFRGGGSIDPKTTTVMQFISLLNLYKKANDAKPR